MVGGLSTTDGWRARCRETGTAGSVRGVEKRAVFRENQNCRPMQRALLLHSINRYLSVLSVLRGSSLSPNPGGFGLEVDLQAKPDQARIQDPARTLVGRAEGRHHARHRVAVAEVEDVYQRLDAQRLAVLEYLAE